MSKEEIELMQDALEANYHDKPKSEMFKRIWLVMAACHYLGTNADLLPNKQAFRDMAMYKKELRGLGEIWDDYRVFLRKWGSVKPDIFLNEVRKAANSILDEMMAPKEQYNEKGEIELKDEGATVPQIMQMSKTSTILFYWANIWHSVPYEKLVDFNKGLHDLRDELRGDKKSKKQELLEWLASYPSDTISKETVFNKIIQVYNESL